MKQTMRWTPLPIDSQVVAALEDRKQNYIQAAASCLGQDPRQTMVFNHVCTVLEHAKRIFEMSEQELHDLNEPDMFKTTHDRSETDKPDNTDYQIYSQTN